DQFRALVTLLGVGLESPAQTGGDGRAAGEQQERQHEHEDHDDDDGTDHAAIIASASADASPGLDLDEGADGQRRHREGGASRSVVTERLDVGLVHRRVVVDVGEEHGGLHHVGQRRTLALQQGGDVGDGLGGLALDPAAGEGAVDEADLPRAHQPLARSHDGCVRADGFGCGHRRTVGHSGGRPSASQAAAATAAKTASEPLTGGPSSGSIVTSTGGMSTARRMPNDRMVRSWGTPSSSTAMPSDRTHPSAMWAAPMQYDRSTTSSSGSPHRTRTFTRPSTSSASAMAPVGDVTCARPDTAAISTAASAQPAARNAIDVGGPATSTSCTSMPGATACTASARPGVRTARSTPVPSARIPAAIGGRLGPRCTVSSRDSSTRTGRPCSLANRRATSATGDAALPPNAPPLASGVTGSPPGAHHEASGSRYAGSTHVVRKVSAQSPGGTS